MSHLNDSNQYNLTHKKLSNQLKLIRTSLECPSCGAPTGDLSNKKQFQCLYCQESFLVKNINLNSKEHLSYQKLKTMSDLQVSNTTMSSRLDVQYNPELFIDRKAITMKFGNFIEERSPVKKLFLLLGEAGFGKTWLVANWANKLREKGYIVFYVRLIEGLDTFFKITFNNTRTVALNDIRETMDEISDDKKPLIWIMDAYDEIYDLTQKQLLMAEFLKFIEKSKNQYLIITSRAYDWEKCRIRQDQKIKLNQLIWKENQAEKDSAKLLTFGQNEIERALKSYQLPALDNWVEELKILAKYPLWVRIIGEWYKKNLELPDVSIPAIYEMYFTRMGIGNKELRTLSQFCNQLIRKGDLEREISLSTQVSIDERSLDSLNSSGILLYKEDIYDAIINLSSPTFAWFGTAFYALNLYRSHQLDELKNLIEVIERLPPRDNIIILKLIDSFNIKRIEITNLKKKIEGAQLLMADNQFSEAIIKWQEVKDIANKQDLYDISQNAKKQYQHCKKLLKRKQIKEEIKREMELAQKLMDNDQIDKSMDKWKQIIDTANKYDLQQIRRNAINQYNNCSKRYKERPNKILKELEKIIGKSIPQVKKIKWNTVGVKFDGDAVLGLGLYKCGLTTLLKPILELKTLQIFSLDHNELTTLPESFGQLRTLQKLNLAHNELRTLPESFGTLKSLKELYLYNNQLTSLPMSFGRLRSLRELGLNGNKLKSLPESLLELSNLKTIYITGNPLGKSAKKILENLEGKKVSISY